MSPALQAHLRLMETLPKERIREHVYIQRPDPMRNSHPKTSPDDKRGGQNRRPIQFEGRTYRSMTHMMKHLHVGIRTIYKWLDEGRAVRDPK